MILTAQTKTDEKWEPLDVPVKIDEVEPFLKKHDGTETVVCLVEAGRKTCYCGSYKLRDRYVQSGIPAKMFYDLVVKINEGGN